MQAEEILERLIAAGFEESSEDTDYGRVFVIAKGELEHWAALLATPAGAPAEEQCICKQALPWLAMMDPNCPVHRHCIVNPDPAVDPLEQKVQDHFASVSDEELLRGVKEAGFKLRPLPAPAAGVATPEIHKCWSGSCGVCPACLAKIEECRIKLVEIKAGAATPDNVVLVSRNLLIEAVDNLRVVAERLDHSGHHFRAEWANQMADDFAVVLAQGGKAGE